MDWNEGYVTSSNYTYGLYNDFNPARIPFLFGLAGITPPAISTACELGYGQGVSLNVFAAAEPVAWYGTDFNPSQAGHARELAKASGAKAFCFADSFRDFCERDDLPLFDYIALHGIWAWISRENQAEIVHLIDKKLRVGGVLYISYNTYPGWGPMLPVREMMRAYVDSAGSHGESVEVEVDKTLQFMTDLLAVNPAYAQVAPKISERLQAMKGLNKAYVGHEYLNDVWRPDTFAYMAKTLESARMTYACSAAFLDALANVGLTKEQQDFLAGIKDRTLQQMARDFIRNIQFRKDFWVKGKVPLGKRGQGELLRSQSFMLINPDTTNEIKSNTGSINIGQPLFDIIMSVFGDMKAHTMADLERAGKADSIPLANFISPVCAMLDFGVMAVTQKSGDIAKSRATSERLNQYLENRALENADILYMASPVSGGGVPVSRFNQIFLVAMRKGRKNREDLARFLWQILQENGERITKDGKTLETEEESMPELLNHADRFLKKALPVLRALQVA